MTFLEGTLQLSNGARDSHLDLNHGFGWVNSYMCVYRNADASAILEHVVTCNKSQYVFQDSTMLHSPWL